MQPFSGGKYAAGMTRRGALRFVLTSTGAALLAACSGPTPPAVDECPRRRLSDCEKMRCTEARDRDRPDLSCAGLRLEFARHCLAN